MTSQLWKRTASEPNNLVVDKKKLGGRLVERLANARLFELSCFAKSCRRQHDAAQEEARIEGDVKREVNNRHAKHTATERGSARR